MQSIKRWTTAAVALAIVGLATAPASGSTFVRSSLDELVASSSTVVVAQVLDAHPHWNTEHNFIFTDIRLTTLETLKGKPGTGELTVTLMGGTVGDITNLVIGAPVLVPGRSYVLFLNREPLPGKRALTVRDQLQGAFDVVEVGGEIKAVSQAVQHPLLPDVFGVSEPPGGKQGLPLEGMIDTIRAIVRSAR
ncbi:MAG TPA: hypothetical protein PK413_01665 [Thermoanaerobaculia bacterium]|nr:hypothetical protein [Thermoanaerobaculia bacterium]